MNNEKQSQSQSQEKKASKKKAKKSSCQSVRKEVIDDKIVGKQKSNVKSPSNLDGNEKGVSISGKKNKEKSKEKRDKRTTPVFTKPDMKKSSLIAAGKSQECTNSQNNVNEPNNVRKSGKKNSGSSVNKGPREKSKSKNGTKKKEKSGTVNKAIAAVSNMIRDAKKEVRKALNKSHLQMTPSESQPLVEPLEKTVYQFTVKTRTGETVSMERYRGLPLIIVNLASNDLLLCAKNIQQLNHLFTNYQQHGLRIAGFPSNDFHCEPLDDSEMEEFIKKQDIHFDVYAKTSVVGELAHPVYVWLRANKLKLKNTGHSNNTEQEPFEAVKFNFTKFLIDRRGLLFRWYGPFYDPLLIESEIKALLL